MNITISIWAAKNGTEIVIFMQRLLWERYKDDDKYGIFTTDFKNAFNYLYRKWMRNI